MKFLLLVIVGLFLTTPFLAAQAVSGPGIGGYDLLSPADLSFPFDYTGSGHEDYMVFYRPGTGVIYIIQNLLGGPPATFKAVWQSTTGIGGYDLMSPADRVVPFDYNGSGKQDHLLCYRPGTGIVQILASTSLGWLPVYKSTTGIGGYDLMSTNDIIVPFDYNGSGTADHLLLYRPGTGVVWIVEHTNKVLAGFDPVYQSNDGIGWYDLMSTRDRIVPYDAMSTGLNDHLVAYRLGKGVIYIIQNNDGVFSPTFQSSNGLATYDLLSVWDVLLPFDNDHSGKLDHLLCYRPGYGVAYIISWDFNTVFASTIGIGAYDLRSTSDKIYPFDYFNAGKLDHLVLYRPGTGVIYILQHQVDGFFPTVYQSTP
jgi:hypothetical protein